MTINILDEIKSDFLEMGKEGNTNRAFPDARDGLKPAQRASLWEMYIKGYNSSKPHVKSAKISGGVIASWHPHGDTSAYETFMRMSQPWINNIPEVDWHGANGSIIYSSKPASARYTEARLAKVSEDGFFSNIKKDTVDMVANYSEDEEWPDVFPAIFPRLFVNGSDGIGFGVANTWIPGNLKEFLEKVKQYLETKNITCNDIYPDFPTGGIIINKDDLENIYQTGKGKIIVRGKANIQGNNILITELPYQVYVEPLIADIKALIEDGTITGIEDIYNKSDDNGLLIEIECSGSPGAVLAKLYDTTDLQCAYNPNQTALVNGVPQLLNLLDYIEIYVNHNLQCIKREYIFELNKAQKRLEIVDGLLKALAQIDDVIKTIKKAKSAEDAKQDLTSTFGFTEPQAKAIVDMKLGRLAHLESVELNDEKAELDKKIKDCTDFIASDDLQSAEFLRRLEAFVNKYGWDRRTEVTQVAIAKTKAEKEVAAVEPEKCVVILTEGDMIKRIPSTQFKVQKRNGTGIKTPNDIVRATIRTNTVDKLMFFTNKGKMYRLLVNNIPEGTNTSPGTSIYSLIKLDKDEKLETIYSLYKDTTAKYVVFITKKGLVKKTELSEYTSTTRNAGLLAVTLKDDDALSNVLLMEDEQLILVSKKGKAIRFETSNINPVGRAAKGVIGFNLDDDDEVIGGVALRDMNDDLAVFVTGGMAKRVSLNDIVTQNRGGKGIVVYKPTPATGEVSAITLINDNDELLVSGNNSAICVKGKDIPVLGRTAQGNIIIKNNKITSVSKV